MGSDLNAVKESYQAVVLELNAVVALFYQTLFARYPDVAPLFEKTDMAAQKHKLVQTIGMLILHLENPQHLSDPLRRMGRRHLDYGARAAHYPGVAECLIHAFRTLAGARWRPEMGEAWQRALQLAAEEMLAGANQRHAA